MILDRAERYRDQNLLEHLRDVIDGGRIVGSGPVRAVLDAGIDPGGVRFGLGPLIVARRTHRAPPGVAIHSTSATVGRVLAGRHPRKRSIGRSRATLE